MILFNMARYTIIIDTDRSDDAALASELISRGGMPAEEFFREVLRNVLAVLRLVASNSDVKLAKESLDMEHLRGFDN